MEASSAQKSEKFSIVINRIIKHIFNLIKGTFKLGQTARVWIDCIHKFAAALDTIQTLTEEAKLLQEKIVEMEKDKECIEAIHIKLNEHQRNLVLLKKGRNFIQNRDY